MQYRDATKQEALQEAKNEQHATVIEAGKVITRKGDLVQDRNAPLRFLEDLRPNVVQLGK